MRKSFRERTAPLIARRKARSIEKSAPRMFINGRFLGKDITGVQRFARGIVMALDRLLAEEGIDWNVSIVAPQGTPPPEGLKCIGFVAVGRRKGHLWEQLDLYRATRSGFLFNPEGCGPLFKRNQLTIIHDAAVYRRPRNFAFAYRTWHQMMGRVLSRLSRLGTVSLFSQQELSVILHVVPESILVVPNGYEHILTIAPEKDVLQRLGLESRPYLLFVGSPAPNKNLARVVEAFNLLNRPDAKLVIVGGANEALFKRGLVKAPANVMLPGRLSDGEIVALYQNAAAMVFPSTYEGFGIPPLEAMAHGCPVIASRIPAVEEVCDGAALYFDPLQPKEIAAKMQEILDTAELRAALIEKGYARLGKFTWRRSAGKLLAECYSLVKGYYASVRSKTNSTALPPKMPMALTSSSTDGVETP